MSADSAPQDRSSPRDIQSCYERIGRWMSIVAPLERLVLGRVRARQFGGLDGRVLDVACGSGPNFRYLHPSAEIVGVDLSPAMLAQASGELARLGRDGSLGRMDAGNLAFKNDAFDAVISSLSTCTFPDPIAAIQEMARVCKPDGRIALLEHGKSSIRPIAALQERYAGIHARHCCCQLTQDPLDHPLDAGLAIEGYREDPTGILTAMDIRPVAGRP